MGRPHVSDLAGALETGVTLSPSLLEDEKRPEIHRFFGAFLL